jgi:hypothetical protein
MPEQPDRGLSAAELMQKQAAEEVARREAPTSPSGGIPSARRCDADDPIRIRDAGGKRLKGRTPQCAQHLPGERLSGVRGVVASPYCSLWCRIKPRFWALHSLSIAALLSLSCCADPNAEMSKAKATASNRIARLNGAAIT